jgi:deoxyribodipyrimidine photo-lyase
MCTVVLLTRCLRVHDHPALARAARVGGGVVPLFVFDEEIIARFGAPNRIAFLLESLADLDASLRDRGSALVVRRGDVVVEAMRVATEAAAKAIFVSDDVSDYARIREVRLRRAANVAGIELRTFPGVTVVPPGDVTPKGGGDHFKVFTPYWSRWREAPRRAVLEPPAALETPPVDTWRLPELPDLVGGTPARSLVPGGETEGRRRLDRWLDQGLADYDERRDELAAGATSGLSPYLHFGCLSPLEVVERALASPGGAAFARQLCWRDFHHQLLAAEPRAARRDLRPRADRWHDDPDGLTAWQAGMTGYPIVDAGMRQLEAEGTMPNRLRLVTASFLTKHLSIDWRLGAEHFARHLVDGDLANNALNWQWVAGTGADTRPNRVFNPIRQARRFDPAGDYVRRWVPELEELDGGAVHEPWRAGLLRPAAYPFPIVEHEEAVSRFRSARAVAR